MPTEFWALACVECKLFQVTQKKKSNKWSCVVCGTPQSVQKVRCLIYAVSYQAKDIRAVVQQLNAERGNRAEERLLTEPAEQLPVADHPEVANEAQSHFASVHGFHSHAGAETLADTAPDPVTAARSKRWDRFLPEPSVPSQVVAADVADQPCDAVADVVDGRVYVTAPSLPLPSVAGSSGARRGGTTTGRPRVAHRRAVLGAVNVCDEWDSGSARAERGTEQYPLPSLQGRKRDFAGGATERAAGDPEWMARLKRSQVQIAAEADDRASFAEPAAFSDRSVMPPPPPRAPFAAPGPNSASGAPMSQELASRGREWALVSADVRTHSTRTVEPVAPAANGAPIASSRWARFVAPASAGASTAPPAAGPADETDDAVFLTVLDEEFERVE